MKKRILSAMVTMSLLVVLVVGAKAGEIKEPIELGRECFDKRGFLKDEVYQELKISGILKINSSVIEDVEEVAPTSSAYWVILTKDGKCYRYLIDSNTF